MSVQTTPSKKVRRAVVATTLPSTNKTLQAASALESFKMESPVKKLGLQSEADKENIEAKYEADEVAVPIKGIPELPEEPVQDPVAAIVATTLKEEEAVEPILQENPQRFVMFPIKYHEV